MYARVMETCNAYVNMGTHVNTEDPIPLLFPTQRGDGAWAENKKDEKRKMDDDGEATARRTRKYACNTKGMDHGQITDRRTDKYARRRIDHDEEATARRTRKYACNTG